MHATGSVILYKRTTVVQTAGVDGWYRSFNSRQLKRPFIGDKKAVVFYTTYNMV